MTLVPPPAKLRLYDIPYAYDVVLSDFGRDATLRLLRETASLERDFIVRILRDDLGASNPAFFDEYRRIMFTCVGDVAYVKSDLLRRYTEPGIPLDPRILFGVGDTRIGQSEVEAIAETLVTPIETGIARGYRRLRVVLPCNTLASVERKLTYILSTRLPSAKFIELPLGDNRTEPCESDVTVSLHSVPRVVLNHLVTGVEGSAKLMLVGTELARQVYRAVLSDWGARRIDIVECTREEQDAMDRLVVASIGGQRGDIVVLKQQFERTVLRPRQREFGDSFVVVEASTDLDLGIGVNSLRILAEELVLGVYGWALSESSVVGPRAAPSLAKGLRYGTGSDDNDISAQK